MAHEQNGAAILRSDVREARGDGAALIGRVDVRSRRGVREERVNDDELRLDFGFADKKSS